jgi:hypothetical protein
MVKTINQFSLILQQTWSFLAAEPDLQVTRPGSGVLSRGKADEKDGIA